uniref:VWFC domain-containing protein n=1 Tax=Trichogramma kaykai TaxID=54128 RepID=A0ABD2VVE7_9HYME
MSGKSSRYAKSLAPTAESGRCFHEDSCPDDSTTDSKGQCVCIPHCPTAQPCEDGQHSLMVKSGDSSQPGKCCPLYECRAQELVRYEFGPTTGKLLDNCVDRSGNHHNFNDEWIDSMDPCMQCRCLDGKESCVIPHCKPCNHRLPPRKDQCCGDCVDRPIDCQVAPPLDCELRCETFDVNEQGCQICKCLDNGEVLHNNSSNKEQQQTTNTIDAASAGPTVLDAENPAKSSVAANCTKPNCPQAKTVCPYGNLLDSNGCPTCSCRLECPRLDSCLKKCPQGYRRDDKGCQICKCRSNCQDPDSRQIYKPDETWSPDPCRKCVCKQNGHISCSDTTECINYCENPMPPSNGSCCPICPPKTTMEGEASGNSTSTSSSASSSRGWGVVPITLICVLGLLCCMLMAHLVRNRFRARLPTSENEFTNAYPQQYYKCIPVYESHLSRNTEKLAPL